MADRILIINKGQKVAFGTVEELKAQYTSTNQLQVSTNISTAEMGALLQSLGGSIHREENHGAHTRFSCTLPKTEDAQELLKKLMQKPGASVSEFVRSTPTLESIFLQATARREDT